MGFGWSLAMQQGLYGSMEFLIFNFAGILPGIVKSPAIAQNLIAIINKNVGRANRAEKLGDLLVLINEIRKPVVFVAPADQEVFGAIFWMLSPVVGTNADKLNSRGDTLVSEGDKSVLNSLNVRAMGTNKQNHRNFSPFELR